MATIRTRLTRWWQRNIAGGYDALAIYSRAHGNQYVFGLANGDGYWPDALEITAPSVDAAIKAAAALVVEMRAISISAWLVQHRAFTRDGVVRLHASQVASLPQSPPASNLSDLEYERASNYGAW